MNCLLRTAAENSPDKTAFRTNGASLNYLDTDRRVSSYSSKLRAQGVGRGDQVAILADNSVDYILLLFALWRIGATAILLNTRLLPSDWSAQLASTKCSLLVSSGSYVFDTDIEQIDLDSFPTAYLDADSKTNIELDETSAAVVIFTSGSTGHSKGVVLSLGNCLASASASNEITGLSVGDSWLLNLPIYHVAGLGIIFRCVLAGATVVLRSVEELEAGSITHFSFVPTQLKRLLEDRSAFANVKCVILSGASCSAELQNMIKTRQLPVLTAYGMTETSAHCVCLRLSDTPRKLDTVGKAFGGTKIRLLDSSGEESQVGEVTISGPTVSSRYIDGTTALKSGWLHTGDLGTIDDQGYLKIIGRVDDMFISGGENIHAGEIESVARDYRGVDACAVIAVEDAQWGQRPVLFVEPSNVDTKELANYLSSRLAKIKIPDKIYPLDKLPLTAIGKVDYSALKKRWLDS